MPKKMYQCTACQKIFTTEAKAKECESKHFGAVEIVDQVFDVEDKGAKYPESIKCKMSNGQVVQYYRRIGL